MNKRIITISALVLLLALVVFMAYDLFFNGPPPQVNPYDFDLKGLKRVDSSTTTYLEISPIRPEMEEIHGIAVDEKNRLFVCGSNRVEVFNSRGDREMAFPVSGTGGCITVHDGNIYVGILDHIEVFGPNGERIKRWKRSAEGSILTSVAANGTSVFVADAGRKVVYRYTPEGELVSRIGQKDPNQGIPGFVIPSPYFDLALRGDAVWVVNPGRHSFENYSFDGHLRGSWGIASNGIEGFCGCCNPSHFALFPDGSFVTSEKGIERVKIYSSSGVFQSLAVPPQSFEEGTVGIDLAVDRQNRILVLDPVKKIIRIFIPKEGIRNQEAKGR